MFARRSFHAWRGGSRFMRESARPPEAGGLSLKSPPSGAILNLRRTSSASSLFNRSVFFWLRYDSSLSANSRGESDTLLWVRFSTVFCRKIVVFCKRYLIYKLLHNFKKIVTASIYRMVIAFFYLNVSEDVVLCKWYWCFSSLPGVANNTVGGRPSLHFPPKKENE